MLYQNIPYVNVPVSRLFFGTAAAPFSTGEDGNALLDAAFSMGITAIDTARVYGQAEEVLGRWLEGRGVRDQVVLLSKCAHHDQVTMRKRVNEREIREDLERSCELLHTNRIDIYLAHRDDPEKDVGEIVEIFNALHAEGRIGAFGGSNWTVERIQAANAYAKAHNLVPFTVSSPNFGLARQVRDLWGGGCVTISGPENQAAREWYEETQMPVVAYSSLGRGLFSGRLKSENSAHADQVLDEFAMLGYASEDNFERLRRCELLSAELGCSVPQLAMAWIFAQKVNTFAAVTATGINRIQQNIAALDIRLTPRQANYLNLLCDSPEG